MKSDCSNILSAQVPLTGSPQFITSAQPPAELAINNRGKRGKASKRRDKGNTRDRSKAGGNNTLL